MIRWFIDWLNSLFWAKPAGVRTNQIMRGTCPLDEEMRSRSLILSPGSVQEASLISGRGGVSDSIDIPYVKAGAVSRIRLTTGEVMWVSSSPEDLKQVLSWPP